MFISFSYRAEEFLIDFRSRSPLCGSGYANVAYLQCVLFLGVPRGFRQTGSENEGIDLRSVALAVCAFVNRFDSLDAEEFND